MRKSRSLRSAGDHVDFDQHARPGQRRHHQERAGGWRDPAIDFAATFTGLKEIADVGNVGRDLVDVLERRAVLLQ